jgi:signal transduction histidine kinase
MLRPKFAFMRTKKGPYQPAPGRGLSSKILIIAIVLMLLGQLLIFIPSLARYRSSYLDQRVVVVQLATTAAQSTTGDAATADLAQHMLDEGGVLSASARYGEVSAQLGPRLKPERVFDLRQLGFVRDVADTFETMLIGKNRLIGVKAVSPIDPNVVIDLVIYEDPMRQALRVYAGRAFLLSLVISAVVCALLFWTLQRLFVVPMAALTRSMARFRGRPEDISRDPPDTGRLDEVGFVEREFASMRDDVRQALAHKQRLAALGAAVAQITHDLRNILSSAVLLSDRLEISQDPVAKEVGPRLITALDRAIRLCTEARAFAHGSRRTPQRTQFELLPLVTEVRDTLAASGLAAGAWSIEVPEGLNVLADRDELFRVLLAIVRTAHESFGETGGHIDIVAQPGERATFIYVTDNGPGIPEEKRADLFETFVSADRAGGGGLSLVVCREIMRAHGGDIELVGSRPGKTTFRLVLPARDKGGE